ncbi:vegetative cell wall protein gp1-like isoform X2 [Penaeus japonicus]|uniref:vegetative cell wall protein gp1-like isoform X2 n=1 Tax=Penaeus japonicus TaxID=27405 RepID=UPI001C710AA9|nr:vegetative cell wall protein gp1-like isoform X2 [Penaeus japonicus]
MEAQNTGMPGAAPPSSSQTPGYPGAPPPYTQYFAQQCPGGSSPGGAAPYGLGFCVPPPVSHQQPYPLGHSEPPPPYPGGTSLYPDISQCPQPQAGTVPFTGSWPYLRPVPYTGSVGAPHGPRSDVMHGVLHSAVTASPASNKTPHKEHGFLFPLYGSEAPCAPSPPVEESLASSRPFFDPSSLDTGSRYFSQASPYNSFHPNQFSFQSGNTTPHRSRSQVVYGFGPASPTAPPNQPAHPSLTPTRPAPSPPAHHHSPARPPPPAPTEYTTVGNFPKDPSLNGRARSPPLREGEAPPSCVVSWRGAAGLKLYFIQPEGHIVSPLKPLSLTVFKKIGGTPTTGDNSLIGCLEIPGVWRLKLRAKRCFCLHTYPDSYVFLDDSTNPQRVVVLQLPEDVSTTMLADLLALLREMTDLREEQEGVVDKITTGVSTVYTDLTKKINTAVKDTVPGAHKSTKWLRKGTGSLVRLGGNLVSKGMHLIADQVSPGNPQEEESAVHSSLVDTLITFRKKLETNEVTYV